MATFFSWFAQVSGGGKMSEKQEKYSILAMGSLGTLLLVYASVVGIFLVRVLPLVKGRESVPLHYTVSLGIDAVGPWWRLGELPLLVAVCVLGNILFAKVFLRKHVVFREVMWVTCVAIAILFLLASLHLALMNIAYG